MVLARWQATIVDDAGNVQPGASIEVRREVSGAPLANLFSDRDGTVPIGNPFAADNEGFAAFHVIGGAYRITATLGGFSRTWRYAGVGLAGEQDGTVAGTRLRFNPDTDDSDPGSGYIKLNNSDFSAVSEIYVSNENYLGFDISALIDTYDDGGTSLNRGLLTVQFANRDGFFVAQVTGDIVVNGSPSLYRTISVTPIAYSVGSVAQNDLVGIDFNQASGGLSAPISLGDIQDIPTSRILGRSSPSTGEIEQLTVSQVLDLIGSATEGDIIFRGASGWELLPHGNDGDVLQVSSVGSPAVLLPSWGPGGGGSANDFQRFNGSGTWTKPDLPANSRVLVRLWAGGGSGRRASAGSGGGGGGGGACAEVWFLLSDLGATETVTIGSGGAAQTSANTDGNAGGNSTFGSLLTSYGGGGGGQAGAGGGGIFSVGSVGTADGGAGGSPNGGAGGVSSTPGGDSAYGGGGGSDSTSLAGGASVYGGGGGGRGAGVGTAGSNGGPSLHGGGGGGGGGDTGSSSGGVSVDGGNGGGGTSGNTPGNAGTQPAGGGGGSETANSGAGADGRCDVYVFAGSS